MPVWAMDGNPVSKSKTGGGIEVNYDHSVFLQSAVAEMLHTVP